LLALLGGLFGYRRWKAGREDSLADFGESTTVPRPELSMPPPAAAPAEPAPQAAAQVPVPPTPAQVSAAVARRLAAVPGLDLARGLALLRGNSEKYQALLRRFVDWHALDATRIDQSLQRGDAAQVRQLAHALYGAASTLGADSIAAAARQLERPSDTAPGDPVAQQVALAALRTGLADLVQALGDAPAPAEAPVADGVPAG
jgi:HPt (histidine-containing phosphotransfer) domain-containing protein